MLEQLGGPGQENLGDEAGRQQLLWPFLHVEHLYIRKDSFSVGLHAPSGCTETPSHEP